MPSSPDANHGAELAVRLRTGYQQIIAHVHRRLAEAGYADVRPAHMTIFQHLRPEGSRIGELAERAQLTNQSVGYLVDHLERQGYVERRPDPANRRATLVCLTDHGWAEMRACAGILDELERDLAERLDPARLAGLQTLLVDLGDALTEIDAVAAGARSPRP
ncbi:MAG TPA: MarR family transcriptional regulator [Thermomicrobiales bacterium]|nr:MarR family transcriptional regulator [Thermomicrobiales bacterium]